jgi:hypothetical protein
MRRKDGSLSNNAPWNKALANTQKMLEQFETMERRAQAKAGGEET